MYRIIIEYDGPPWGLHGTKEELAMCCEKHGDCRVVSIEEINRRYTQMPIQASGGAGYDKP